MKLSEKKKTIAEKFTETLQSEHQSRKNSI